VNFIYVVHYLHQGGYVIHVVYLFINYLIINLIARF